MPVCRDKQRVIYTSPLKALSNQVILMSQMEFWSAISLQCSHEKQLMLAHCGCRSTGSFMRSLQMWA